MGIKPNTDGNTNYKEKELPNHYTASDNRYDDSADLYRRCGRSGVLLPKVSLGFWHNFGGVDSYDRARAIARCAFDNGITHLIWPTTMALPMARQSRRWAN